MNQNDLKIDFRSATIEDLPAILTLLAEDVFGAQREKLDAETLVKYESAFRDIKSQHGNDIILGIIDNEVIAMLQLTFIPTLSRQGGTRAQIESVRVRSDLRGKGLGKLLFDKIVEISKASGCTMIQLTTDRRRDDAIRFYERLGFKTSHFGMKLAL